MSCHSESRCDGSSCRTGLTGACADRKDSLDVRKVEAGESVCQYLRRNEITKLNSDWAPIFVMDSFVLSLPIPSRDHKGRLERRLYS